MFSFLRNIFIYLAFVIPGFLSADYLKPMVKSKFVVDHTEGSRVFDKNGGWLQLGGLNVGDTVSVADITEDVAKYGQNGFYLRYNVVLPGGRSQHVDGIIRGSESDLGIWHWFKSVRVVTDVTVKAIVQRSFNGAVYVPRVNSLWINVTLDDGSVHGIRSNVHTWVDPHNPPAFPIDIDDIVYVFDDRLIVIDDAGGVREFPLYRKG